MEWEVGSNDRFITFSDVPSICVTIDSYEIHISIEPTSVIRE